MDSWDEIRTAYHVAQAGTVSGAAEALGVHHATVIRHINALEERLGVKLFQRHSRGYTATEAGADLLQVAKTTDDQFSQLEGRIKGLGKGVSGDLVVTSLARLSPLMVPGLTEYQAEHPDVRVRYLTSDRLFRLEYGEAHVAVRAGAMPEDPDNVVQPFCHQNMTLAGSKAYVEKHGMPKDEADLARHKFVGQDNDNNRAPFNRWLRDVVDPDGIVFRATDAPVMREAILAGAGLGFVSNHELRSYPDLVEVMPSKPEWSAALWLVTHVDLHRTAKVQSFLSYLKDKATTWDV
ncbi:LysR family transcriptional regulator [Cognatiyoonia sp.]|uniref:LysR family transcriptional regulator n=1 Tax=Cognatiyoonia sp. TaxID=2211652 RepID=UPI003F69F032